MQQGGVIYTVRELNLRIQELVAGEPWLGSLGVCGEIADFGRDKKGHIYFSLKDPSGMIAAVMFAGKQTYGLGFAPKNGDKVHAYGHIDVYARQGKYQLYVDRLVRVGDGEVSIRLQQLIRKLEGMGLFSKEYKKEVPPYPRRIGIVTAGGAGAMSSGRERGRVGTSGTKAAINDMMEKVRERDPYAEVYFYPSAVQGQYAAADMSRGIELLDEMGLDVIIVGRGGGSEEDLGAFNEEQLAWAIFNAETPIVSATGHSINTTIADMVADRSAITPTDAVVQILPRVKDTVGEFDSRLMYMRSVFMGRLEKAKADARGYERRVSLSSPWRRVDGMKNTLSGYEMRMGLSSPEKRIDGMKTGLADMSARADRAMKDIYRDKLHEWERLTTRLTALSPTAKLVNGFGYISSGGEPVNTVSSVKKGDRLQLTLHDGGIEAEACQITRVEDEQNE